VALRRAGSVGDIEVDEDTRPVELAAMIVAGLEPQDLWPGYFHGTQCSELELDAYLHGALILPPAETSYLADSMSGQLRRKSRKPVGPVPLCLNIGRTKRSSGTQYRAAEDALAALGAAGRFLLTPERAEMERLKSLRETGLLHTGTEGTFDRVVATAKQFFGVGAASLSLIGKDAQFLKSAVGPLRRETPRNIALCTHTLQQNSLLIINDTLADERYSSNPLVVGEPFIRFYAGYPLRGPRGWNIGTMCIIDQKPRSFPVSGQEQLRTFAGIIQREIDTRT
jgi:hypothetical protein